ncbi:mobilization protein, partial [Klebsiella pneumoniae]
GHATRKDALCLLAGIVSAPKDIAPEAWEAFQRDSVGWLQGKYGKALRTVIAHHDESHPHLHFYVIPEAGNRFESVHQGRLAAAEVKAQGGVKGLQNQA